MELKILLILIFRSVERLGILIGAAFLLYTGCKILQYELSRRTKQPNASGVAIEASGSPSAGVSAGGKPSYSFSISGLTQGSLIVLMGIVTLNLSLLNKFNSESSSIKTTEEVGPGGSIIRTVTKTEGAESWSTKVDKFETFKDLLNANFNAVLDTNCGAKYGPAICQLLREHARLQATRYQAALADAKARGTAPTELATYGQYLKYYQIVSDEKYGSDEEFKKSYQVFLNNALQLVKKPDTWKWSDMQ